MAVGQLPRRIMREPYAQTLWTYLQLKDHERIEGLRRRKRQIDEAALAAFAFHEPRRIGDEYHQWKADIGLLPTHEEALDRAHDVIVAMRKIDRGEHPTTVVSGAIAEERDGH